MEGANCAFFYSARCFTLNTTVISLVEQPGLDWRGRIEYLRAKTERRKLDLYAMDLVWLLTKAEMVRYGTFEFPMPTDMEWGELRKDTRSAEQIKRDLIKKLTESE